MKCELTPRQSMERLLKNFKKAEEFEKELEEEERKNNR